MKKISLLFITVFLGACHYCGDAVMAYSAHCVNPNDYNKLNQPISDEMDDWASFGDAGAGDAQ